MNEAQKFYRWFIVLLVVYSIGYLLIIPHASISIQIVIVSILALITWIKYIKAAPLLRQKKYEDKGLITCFLLWQFIVIIRGLLFNTSSLSSLITTPFTNPYSLFALLLPYIVVLNPINIDFRFLTRLMTWMMLIFLLAVYLNYQQIFKEQYVIQASVAGQETYGNLVSIVSHVTSFYNMTSFLVFLPCFISKKKWYTNFACLCLAIVIVMLGARRSGLAVNLLILISALYFYSKSYYHTGFLRKFVIAVFLFGAIIVLIQSFESTFSLLYERGLHNSRETVESEYWIDMGNSLDWIWGRGLNGSYYAASVSYLDSAASKQRALIETGYLNIILFGGVISLFLYVTIQLRAAIKGFRHSNNYLTKAFSAFIMVNLVALIPFGLPAFSLNFFIVWVGVAICNNREFRSMTNEQIRQQYFS